MKYFDEEEKNLIASIASNQWQSDFNLNIKKQYQESLLKPLNRWINFNHREVINYLINLYILGT